MSNNDVGQTTEANAGLDRYVGLYARSRSDASGILYLE